MSEAVNVRRKRRAGGLVRAVLDRLARLTPSGPWLAENAPRRIAVSLYWGVGDAVQMLPLLQALRDFYPDAHIAALGKPWLADLFGDQGLFDEVIELVPPWTRHRSKYRLWDSAWRGFLHRGLALRRERFDLFVGVRPDPREAVVARLINARAFAGQAALGGRGWMAVDLGAGLSDPVNAPGGEVAARAAMALTSRDVSPIPRFAKFEPSPEPNLPGPILAVSFGASHPIRRWNGPAISRVLASLKTPPGTLLLIEGDGPEIAPPEGWNSVRWKGDLRTLRNRLASVDLLFCTDSGIMHIGAAAGCKVLAVFTSGNISRFAPPGHPLYRVEPMPCRPCGDHCIYDLPLCVDRIDETVVAALIDATLARKKLA